jgi:hypothetical protein
LKPKLCRVKRVAQADKIGKDVADAFKRIGNHGFARLDEVKPIRGIVTIATR